jgi:adenylate cyclase, class 2
MHLNYEFKARTEKSGELEKRLLSLNPRFVGEDHQRDTYFNVPRGRLKLREGNIENALIQYDRENVAGAKTSHVVLYAHKHDPALKEALIKSLGVKVVVEKRRKIYFVGNVKFHFDRVTSLGEFVEVEAIDEKGEIGVATLRKQCDEYAELFGIENKDFISVSYSDMLLYKSGYGSDAPANDDPSFGGTGF